MPWENGGKRRISDETRAAIIEARKEGGQYKELSARFDVSNYTVHKILIGAGLVVPKGTKRKPSVVIPEGSATPKNVPHADLLPGTMPDWMFEGSCGQVGPRWFFPDEDEDAPRGRGMSYLEGRKVCADCPVRAKCLQYALDTRQEHGLWGGVSPRERNRMLKALRDEAVAS